MGHIKLLLCNLHFSLIGHLHFCRKTVYINALLDIFDLKSIIWFFKIKCLLCFLLFCYVISSFFFFFVLLPLLFLLTLSFICEVSFFTPSFLLMAWKVYSLFLILEVITLITLNSIHKHLGLLILFHIQSTDPPQPKTHKLGHVYIPTSFLRCCCWLSLCILLWLEHLHSVLRP